MTKPKRESFDLACWVDERMPERLALAVKQHGLPVDELIRWLAPHLGEYRADVALQKLRPTQSEEVRATVAAASIFREAAELLKPGALPPAANSMLAPLALKIRFSLTEAQDITRDHLLQFAALLNVIAGDLSRQQPRRGRKPSSARDALAKKILAKVVDLKPAYSMEEAREAVSMVLEKCNVPAPDDLRKASKQK